MSRRSRRGASGSGRASLVVVVMLTMLAAAGCATIPTSGPVVRARTSALAGGQEASDIDAVPPRPGEPASDIAKGFLDAMQASPIRLDVARRYLTASAASTWNPDRATITYDSALPPRPARASTVVLPLVHADRLDASGAWQGAVPASQSRLRLRVVRVHGQFRIADPPDALIVPEAWFVPRFRQVSLYYFDPSARILVPTPVFVPRGDQFASALVSALLDGPGPGLRGVVRTFLPRNLTAGLSVPVDQHGVAQLDLGGDTAELSPATTDLALAQLAWTLRQDPDIRSIRLSLGGTRLVLPGGGQDYPVDSATKYDPDGYGATTLAYGLTGRRLVSVAGDDVNRVEGPLDDVDRRLASISVDVSGTRVAAVTASRRRVIIAPLGGAADEPKARARTVIRGARGLLRVAWDALGRWWVIDRGPGGGAQVSVVAGGRRRTVVVPGITGARVTSFLVSRDGTRLIAVEHRRRTDRLVQARLRNDRRGRVLGATRALPLPTTTRQLRVQALCWTSPVTLAVSSSSVPGQVSEIRTLNLDGSPPADGSLATSVPSAVRSLACSPDPAAVPYALTPGGPIDLSTGGSTTFSSPVSLLGYAG